MEKDRIYQRIAGLIREKIRDKTYAVGSRIPPERDLATQLGVSRTSVREAIIALEVSGWVEVRVGSGVYVRQPEPGNVHHEDPPIHPALLPHLAQANEITPFELLQARLLLEPEIAALAATRRDAAQLQAIKEAYLMNVQDNVNHSREHIGDRLFHIRIAEAAENEAYAFFIRYLLGKQYTELFGRLQQLYTPEDMPLRSQLEHHHILVALESRNAPAARQAMHQHLTNVIRIFMRSIESDAGASADKS